MAYADKDEPDMDCFKIAETYEEAQEVMEYRNHFPSHPTLPVSPKSDLICSAVELKFHRRVELKDHDASEEKKQCFEELCQQYPEVFSTNNEDIGRTNLINMDTSDSPLYAKKPYTLPLKHHDWTQQEIESLEQADIITRSVSPWATLIIVVPKKSAHGEVPRRRMCIDFHAINALQPKVIKANSKVRETSPCTHYQTLISSMHSLEEPKSSLHLISEVATINWAREGLPCKDSICHPIL